MASGTVACPREYIVPAPLTPLRRLGLFERFRVVLHDLGFHNNVAILAQYTLPKPLQISLRSLVFQALEEAILQHPALSATVIDADSAIPRFAHIDEICLDEITTFIDVSQQGEARNARIDSTLSQQHSIGFEMAGPPLWRVLVLKDESTGLVANDVNFDIVLVWHHVIGDGRSGSAVHMTILNALNAAQMDDALSSNEEGTISSKISRSVEDPLVVRTSSKPVWPASETLWPVRSNPWSRLYRTIISWLPLRSDGSTHSHHWSGGPYTAAKPIRTQIRHISIPPDAIDALVKLCRSKQTTMTPFLQCLIGTVLFEVLEEAGSLRCAVAISLRRFFAPSSGIDDSHMGLWVSAFHSEYVRATLCNPSDQSSFWAKARKESMRIKHEIVTGKEDISMSILRDVPNYRSFLMEKIGKARDDSYAVTNLGITATARAANSKTSDVEGWRITDLVFSQSCHVNGSAIQFCVVTLRDGDMCIALSWQEGVVPAELVERISERLRAKLLTAAAEAVM